MAADDIEQRRDPTTNREVERKVRVPEDFELPPLEGVVPGVVTVERGEPISLDAAYHDTEDVRLVRWGATLRRRTGGTDEGWHLKLPVEGAGPGVRDELGLPLDAGETGHVPAPIADVVRSLVREASLVHLATVRTGRTPFVLRDGQGEQLAELVDDRVEIVEGDQVVRTFREIEVEARGEDADDLLDAVVAVYQDAGGTPGTQGKGVAALGARAGGAPDVVVPEWPGPQGPAGDVLRCLLAVNVRKLLLEEVRVRRDLPDAVHQMRVAARTMRSALRTLSALVDEEWADGLRAELKATADALGVYRDTEVHLKRLEKHARSLPPEDGGRAVQAIDGWLRQRLDEGRRAALEELGSDRHLRLLIELVAAAREPRLTKKARKPAQDVLPTLVKKSAMKLAKAVDGAFDGRARRGLAQDADPGQACALRGGGGGARPRHGCAGVGRGVREGDRPARRPARRRRRPGGAARAGRPSGHRRPDRATPSGCCTRSRSTWSVGTARSSRASGRTSARRPRARRCT